ncbi:hypothetical protein [Rhizobium binae]|uniref:hypothetical protein n=1 Tax=Rhizobium binae TaxID=1138190 RepID=UPI001C82B5D6|nr:hypothetical protein [Rhizobium binae]MBX4967713.1 hypothetical protein [Rhizobium binae]
MAENYEKHLKEFSVSLGRHGDKENSYWGFYSRVRTIRDANGRRFEHTGDSIGPGQNWTGEDTRRVLFGLWSSTKEEYVWSGRTDTEGAALFQRTKLTQSKGLATTITDFYDNGTVKEETRKYLSRSRTTQYDAHGDLLSETNSGLLGYRKLGRSEDGRISYIEDKTGPFSRRKEGLVLPDGRSVDWRTVQRNIGPYKMKIDVGKDGKSETRSWSLGKLISRSSEYNFETGKKIISYKFPLRKRDNKERDIPQREMQRHEDRTEQREIAQQQWVDAGVYSSHRVPERTEYNQGFQRALESRAPSGGLDIGAWLENVPTRSSVEQRQQAPKDKQAATRHDRDRSTIAPDDSVSVAFRPGGQQHQPARTTVSANDSHSSYEPTSIEVKAKRQEALRRARRGQEPARIAAPDANSSLAVTEIGATVKAVKLAKRQERDAGVTATSPTPAANNKPGGQKDSHEKQKAPIHQATSFSNSSVAGAPSFASPAIVEMPIPKLAQRPAARAAPALSISNSSVASRQYDARGRNDSRSR